MSNIYIFNIKKLVPAIVWAFFILILCLLPGKDLPQTTIWQFDKMVHFSFYYLLFFLLNRGLTRSNINIQAALLVICFLYGLAIEYMQGAWLKDRYFDIFDAIANGVGALVCMMLTHFYSKHDQIKK
jgi:VanZ family protein